MIDRDAKSYVAAVARMMLIFNLGTKRPNLAD